MARRFLSIDEADDPCGQMSHLYNFEVDWRSQVAFCRGEILTFTTSRTWCGLFFKGEGPRRANGCCKKEKRAKQRKPPPLREPRARERGNGCGCASRRENLLGRD